MIYSQRMSELVFLKLGGSMITYKDKPSSVRAEMLEQAAGELAAARAASPDLRLLLGHGSGSFGHYPAKQHGTRNGVHTDADWGGFVEVWKQAATLNRLVMDALAKAGVRAMAFPPSASATANDGRIASWSLQPISAALSAGIVPVVFGDVAFDTVRNGTILSTEDLFVHLANALKPARILLAGDEQGVLGNYESDPVLIPHITPSSFAALADAVSGAVAPDVTGGMAGKVQAMLALVSELDCEVRIFSGLEAGNIAASLQGETLGTLLTRG
jgi:isopentenyl phosphate kinase